MSQIEYGSTIGAVPGAIPDSTVRAFVDVVPPSQSKIPDLANAPNSSTFHNVQGGTMTTLYVKVSGSWVAVA